MEKNPHGMAGNLHSEGDGHYMRKLDLLLDKVDTLGKQMMQLIFTHEGPPGNPNMGYSRRIEKLEEAHLDQNRRNIEQDVLLRQVRWLWRTVVGAILAGVGAFIYHKFIP